MAPKTMKVGMLWFLALSIHAAAPTNRKQGEACKEWHSMKSKFTKVTANTYSKNSAVAGEEKLYECSAEQSRGFLRCVEAQWRKCVRVCGRPVSPAADAHLDNMETSFAAGAEVSYSCGVGYVHSGGTRSRKCLYKTFTWSPLKIQCERKSCGSAGEILNGDVVYTGAEFGHTATTVCAEGHILVGKANRTCLSDGWDGRPASCEAVQCVEPKTNAESTGSWRPSYSYRQVLVYRCRKGTLVGQKAIWCNESGSWSAPPPVCKDVECPHPNVPDSTRSGSWIPPFKYRASVTFTCNPGYMLVGKASVSCSLKGSWIPDLPKCIWKGWNGK